MLVNPSAFFSCERNQQCIAQRNLGSFPAGKKIESLLNLKEMSSSKRNTNIKKEGNNIMENKELIEKLKKERNEYGIKVNKIDHFLHGGEAGKEDSYYLGLLQEQRSFLNHLAVIVDLRIRYLNGEE